LEPWRGASNLRCDIVALLEMHNIFIKHSKVHKPNGDSDLDSDDGVLLVEQVPDDVIIVAETPLQHNPSALVSPRSH
jgi:hypothetical protein